MALPDKERPWRKGRGSKSSLRALGRKQDKHDGF